MSAAAAAGRLSARAVVRRRLSIAVELMVAVAVCFAGYYGAADWFRVHEAAWAVGVLHLAGVGDVSAVLPGHILIFHGPAAVMDGVVTTACSSILTVVGLTALTVTVLRNRRLHALLGWAVAGVAVVVANVVRLALSALAGVAWGSPALTLFHDWVGTIWTLASTLTGFLLMVHFSLPAAERAEQDVTGRHTARRPTGWARPGLGYRAQEMEEKSTVSRRSLTGYVYRHLLPSSVARGLAARREAARIDYRIGHEPPMERIATVQRLVEDGLGTHTASLLAVATYDEDVAVLDALAQAVAARQWEPVTNERIAALRLWARGWLFARRLGGARQAAVDSAGAASYSADQDTVQPRRMPSLPPVPVPRPRCGRHRERQPAVLVTGAGGPAGVAVVRRLRALGLRVVAADADPAAAGGALADASLTVPRADDPRFVDALIGAADIFDFDVLLSTVAEELPALTAAVDRLVEAGVATWLPDLAAVDLCCDKAAFAERMAAAGVAHPATAVTPEGLANVPGPWIVKPRQGRGSRGLQLLETREAVLSALRRAPDLIAQTRLTGREFTADTLVDRAGDPLIVVPRWREETKAGISVKGTTFESEAVTDVVAQAVRAVGLTGPANVQGFVTPNGGVTVVEINPRFSGGLPLTLAAGADLVAAYVAGIRYPDAPLPRLSFAPGIRMSRFLAETYSGADGRPVVDPSAPCGSA
jgi:carbamoyl-phosphate synthase large subunit